MVENNQAYIRRCGECGRATDDLEFTELPKDGTKRRFKHLCADCRKRNEA